MSCGCDRVESISLHSALNSADCRSPSSPIHKVPICVRLGEEIRVDNDYVSSENIFHLSTAMNLYRLSFVSSR